MDESFDSRPLLDLNKESMGTMIVAEPIDTGGKSGSKIDYKAEAMDFYTTLSKREGSGFFDNLNEP